MFAVVSRIASDISKIAPPLLLEQDDNGFWTETTNPAYTPGPAAAEPLSDPAAVLTNASCLSLLLHGNAYVLKNRDERGVVDALYPLEPSRVKVLVAPDGAVYYELQANDLAGIANDTPPVIVPAREIIHMRWNCLFHRSDGHLAALCHQRRRSRRRRRSRSSSTTFFGKGGRPAGVLIAPTKLDPLSAQRIKADAANFTTGELLVLENGMKYEPVSTTAVQSQLIEQLGWTEEKICEVFGMPISILNSAKQPPYANAEASQLQYKSECLEVHLHEHRERLDRRARAADVSEDRIRRHAADLDGYDDAHERRRRWRSSSGMSPNEVRDYLLRAGAGRRRRAAVSAAAELAGVRALADRQAAPAVARPPPAPTEEQVAATVGDWRSR